jgi:molybdenum cofactor biosynthesis protein B
MRVAAITVSDTRTLADDEGGNKLKERLEAGGFTVSFRAIVKDEPEHLRLVIAKICDQDLADAIVTTGGTGVAPRDQTYEAVAGLLEKTLDGFGEAFRRLSWEQVGAKSILSRAVAGVHRGKLIAALPGSPKAVVLAVDALLVPILPHVKNLLAGKH